MKFHFLSLMLVGLLLRCSSSPNRFEGESHDLSSSDTKVKEIEPELIEKFEVVVKKKKQGKTALKKKVKTRGKLAKKVVKRTSDKKIKASKRVLKRGEKSQEIWSLFDPSFVKVGETFQLDVTYMGISAASVLVKVNTHAKMNGEDIYRFYAQGKSSSYYKWIYEIDDRVESYVKIQDFVPLKYSIVQRESSKDVDHYEYYDRDKLMTYFRYKRNKKGVKSFKKKDEKIPYYSLDYLSCFFFLRGLPMVEGAVYDIPVTTKAKTWILRATIGKKEKISIEYGDFMAVKVDIITQYSGELAKRGKMEVWISDDSSRKFLKFSSEVKFGKIKGEMSSYKIVLAR